MGKRGPAPTPPALAELRGNPGRRKRNDRAPGFDRRKPRAPGWLCDEAKKEWRRLVSELHGVGLLHYVHGGSLAVCCQAYGRYVEAEEKIDETGGEVIEKPSGMLGVNPWARVSEARYKQYVAMGARFGLTPADSGRLVIDDSGVEKEVSLDDLTAGFFGAG